jgi:hypothetical protein
MITDIVTISKALLHGIRNLVEEGETDNLIRRGKDLFWPFDVKQVEGLHLHRSGVGDGVWFRLTDGRFFDSYGEDVDPNPALYDTTAN